MKIGRLTISDRASAGIYADRSGPEIENVLREFLGGGAVFESLIVPDEVEAISAALRKFADAQKCDMVVTTGGTGISARDVTPEATRAVLEKELPGFGEIMRMQSFAKVKTAILSRAVAGHARRVFDCESARQAVGGARVPGNSRAGHPRRDWRICAEKIRIIEMKNEELSMKKRPAKRPRQIVSSFFILHSALKK